MSSMFVKGMKDTFSIVSLSSRAGSDWHRREDEGTAAILERPIAPAFSLHNAGIGQSMHVMNDRQCISSDAASVRLCPRSMKFEEKHNPEI
jgi:hypothetical protein